jgi:tRNA U55 pseudouridine synthase TruB
MASVLGGSAHLTSLRRTRIGSLRASNGVTIEDMQNWEDYFLTPAQGVADLPAVSVDEETASGVRNGVRFVAGPIVSGPEDHPYRVLDPNGELIAIYMRHSDRAQPDVVLPS